MMYRISLKLLIQAAEFRVLSDDIRSLTIGNSSLATVLGPSGLPLKPKIGCPICRTLSTRSYSVACSYLTKAAVRASRILVE